MSRIPTIYEPDGRGPIRRSLTRAFGLPNANPPAEPTADWVLRLTSGNCRLTFVDDDRDGEPIVHYQPVSTRRLLAPGTGMKVELHDFARVEDAPPSLAVTRKLGLAELDLAGLGMAQLAAGLEQSLER